MGEGVCQIWDLYLHRQPIAVKHTDNNTSQAYPAVRGREAQTGRFIFSGAIRALNKGPPFQSGASRRLGRTGGGNEYGVPLIP